MDAYLPAASSAIDAYMAAHQSGTATATALPAVSEMLADPAFTTYFSDAPSLATDAAFSSLLSKLLSARVAPTPPPLSTSIPTSMPSPPASPTSPSTTVLIAAVAALVGSGMLVLIGTVLFRRRRRKQKEKPRRISLVPYSEVVHPYTYPAAYPPPEVSTAALSMFPDPPAKVPAEGDSKAETNGGRGGALGLVLDPRWGAS